MNKLDSKVRPDGHFDGRRARSVRTLADIGASEGATPLNRDSALAHESHRHELLDPTTLRWVADLLKDLGPTGASVAEHLAIVAETAGGALDVRWRREDPRRPTPSGSDRVGVSRSDGARSGATRPAARPELSGSETSVRTVVHDPTKRSRSSGRTSAVATEDPRRVGG